MEYQSELTRFLNQLKQTHPQLETEQRAGRAIWWDKAPINIDERQHAQSAKAPQTGYVYYQNF